MNNLIIKSEILFDLKYISSHLKIKMKSYIRNILKFLFYSFMICFIAISCLAGSLYYKGRIRSKYAEQYVNIISKECSKKSFIFGNKETFDKVRKSQINNLDQNDIVYLKVRLIYNYKKSFQYKLSSTNMESKFGIRSMGMGREWDETIRQIAVEGYAGDIDVIPLEVYSKGYETLLGKEMTIRFLCVSNISSDKDLSWQEILMYMSIDAEKLAISAKYMGPMGDEYDYYLALKKDKYNHWMNFGLDQ